jgi:predicted AlkP superfamily phosphohydrolase/phosphomutase
VNKPGEIIRHKTIVIGLDGATWDIIDPMMKKGELPALASLVEEGSHSPLKSTIPPVSPTAWASFATGVNPGKHGIFGFEVTAEETGEKGFSVIESKRMKVSTLWDIVSSHGLRACLIAVPFTYPPTRVNGIMITGLGTPDERCEYTYPKDVKRFLVRELDYKPDYDRRALTDMRIFDEEMQKVTDCVCDATLHYLGQEEWDLLITIFSITDVIQHVFWKDIDPQHPQYTEKGAYLYGNHIHKYYRRVDELMGKIIDKVPEDRYIIIVSDHGGGPVYKRIALNALLNQKGYLEFSKTVGKDSGFSLSNVLYKIGVDKEKAERLVYRFARPLNLVSFIPKIPKGLVGLFPTTGNLATLDWSKTKAYSQQSYGQVYINTGKREPIGCVSEEEYESLRQELIKELMNFKDPETGANIFDEYYLGEDLYQGEFAKQGPDIYFKTTDPKHEVIGFSKTGDIFVEPFLSGTHTQYGIFICTGPDTKKNTRLENTDIIDICPTVLHLLGLPIPYYTDGKVLYGAFRPDSALAGSEPQYENEKDLKTRGEEQKIAESIRKITF